MLNKMQDYIQLVVIVLVFYLGLTYLPQMLGTCLDGECGFTLGEIVVSLAIPLAFIAFPIVLEMLFYHKGLTQALSDIGITRISWNGIRIALLYLLPLILFYPTFGLLSNTELTLRPSASWMLLNIVLVNGLAEEIMMRGYVFRHLREGRSFWRAATLATAYFAAYHLPLMISEGFILGFIAVISAIPTGYLTAYAYERGNNTTWGPGLLHLGTNALAILIMLPEDVQAIASGLYLLMSIVSAGLITLHAYRAGYDRNNTRMSRRQQTEPTAVVESPAP